MIELTTAFALGDMVVDDYTHVRIQSFAVELAKKVIAIDTLYGTVSDGKFVAGVNVPRTTHKRFYIKGNDYAELIAMLPSSTDVPVYDEVVRELYQWLLDNGHFAGSVV